jgi:hypothetical protein
VYSDETVDRRLDGIVVDDLAVTLFAHRALLVEGKTESSVLYGICDKISPGSLEAAGVSIVPVGSKTSIPLVHAILSSIGIPVYALFDADGGFEKRAKDNGKDSSEIAKERSNHAKENRAVLKYFGLTEEDFPVAMVTDKVAIFDDHLESFLSANWVEWLTACDNIEAATGIRLAKNQLAYRAATLSAEGTVPDVLNQILAKARGNA